MENKITSKTLQLANISTKSTDSVQKELSNKYIFIRNISLPAATVRRHCYWRLEELKIHFYFPIGRA